MIEIEIIKRGVMSAAASVFLASCSQSSNDIRGTLAESGNGIETPDVLADATDAVLDALGRQVDDSGSEEDVSIEVGNSSLKPDANEPALDVGLMDSDVECPVFLPVDEPDFGKPEQPPSSYKPCSPSMPCTDEEFCTADFYQQWEGSEPYGICVRLCYHPKSETPSEMGCHETQFCVAAFACIPLSEDSECDEVRGINVEWKAWCGPKNRTRGGLGGNWDYSQCPCDNPASGMTPKEKATCEEAWAEMQNQ